MPDIRTSDFGGIPYGNTAGRPTPATGKLYSNGETARIELYTATGWQNIVQETPGVSSITGTYLESAGSGTFTIFGTNFVSGCYATAIGTNGVQIDASTTTFTSLVQISATFTGLSNVNEPYDIKVTNPSNLFGMLPDALYINANPVWVTQAGSLGTFADNVAISVSATATDDSTITYSLASGSTLPSGVTLNSSTGLISGTLPDIASNTTYTFTINASDGANPAVSRTFSFVSNAAPIWSTSSGSLGSFNSGSSINLTLSATDVSDTVTYSLASGSSLPSGITLNSTTGVISGTLSSVSTDATYTFIVNANDGVNAVSRSFSITSFAPVLVDYLVVAGGGGGSGYVGEGGGGGGGLRSTVTATGRGGALEAPVSIFKLSNYTVTVGPGGNGGPGGGGTGATNGSDSVFSSITSIGGGRGRFNGGPAGNGGTGGGGAFGGGATKPGGTGTIGQGYDGGSGSDDAGGNARGGGGGGAGSAGGNAANGGGAAGNGGNGVTVSITGSSVTYAGGGGGGANGGTGGSGGTGGGGSSGSSGTANTGGGGGASSTQNTGGAGGSGVVILRWLTSAGTISVGSGLTADATGTDGIYSYKRFTAGTGNVSWI